jgi:predicted PurR-regulated permease PerM
MNSRATAAAAALVGGSARLPFLLAFVGIFGGLAAFGLFGLFLGPVIMAALLTVWREGSTGRFHNRILHPRF